MAKLSGVKTLNDREIEYGGERYVMTEGPAQLGDVARRNEDFYADVELGSFYRVVNDLGDCVAFYDDESDVRGLGGGRFPVDYEDFTLFHRVKSTPQSPDEIRALIEEKRAEIAELEAQISINVDDYVRVIDPYLVGDFSGDIAKVTHVDEDGCDNYTYKIRDVIGNNADWVAVDAIEKITPAAAKAALIAQIEEAFKSA
ncbi:hypothetical protein D3C74_286150 [compost metagenome]